MTYYALFSENGKFLSLDPSTDLFKEVDLLSELKLWDYQNYGDEETWFLGNTARPKVAFSIVPIPDADLKKLR